MTKKTLKQSTAIVDPSLMDLARELEGDIQESGGGGRLTFIKYSGKTRQFTLGRGDEMDMGQVFIAHPATFGKGYVCFVNRKAVGRHMELIKNRANLPSWDELEDHGPYNEQAGEGWKEMRQVQLASPDNPGAAYGFSMSNVSGCFAIEDLQQACIDRMKSGKSAYPVFTFYDVEFEAHGQLNGKPQFDIMGWLSMEAMTAITSGEAELDDVMDPVTAPVTLVEPSKARKKPAAPRKRKR